MAEQKGFFLEEAFLLPDQKTIQHFCETLTKKWKIEVLCKKFLSFLMEQGVIAQSGNIVYASFLEAPKQRNSREENEEKKNGKTPDDWSDSKKRQRTPMQNGQLKVEIGITDTRTT